MEISSDIFTVLSLISTVFVLATSTFVYIYWYSFKYFESKNIPCDVPSIPNGQGFGRLIHPAHFTQHLYNKYKKSGAKVCGYYFFTRPILVPLDLDLVKYILKTNFDNFNDRGN